jgi:K+-transporting ATPase ATPase C chain
MKHALLELKRSLILTLLLAVLLCGVYPFLVRVWARLVFPREAEGSLIVDRNGVLRGSLLLGQPFAAPGFFRSRPSAAGTGYDAANSSGSNLGPTSAKLRDAIRDAAVNYRQENGLAPGTILPADAVTASASGLDPHISLANARLQAGRVAQERGMSPERVLGLIDSCLEGRDLGLFGEPRVNVMRLNARLEGVLP